MKATTLPAARRLAAWTCAALAGCAAAPSADDPGAAPRAEAAAEAASAFEREQRDRALAFERERRLADAALAWEVLAVLRPDADDYRERLTDVRRRIDAAVAERLPRAAQAARRGEHDAAARQYLAILALQPDNAQAADALRALERQRRGAPSRAPAARRTP